MGVGMVLVVSQSVVHQAHQIAGQGLRFGVMSTDVFMLYFLAQPAVQIQALAVFQAEAECLEPLATTHRLTAEGTLPTVMIVADRAILKEKFNSKTK